MVAAVVALLGATLLVGAPGDVARAADVGTFHGQSPQRVLDTRPGGVTVDTSASGTGAVPAGGTIHVRLSGRGGVPASGVGAVALNVTVTGATATGYLTVWPKGAVQPTASNLNFVAGQTVPNMVIVKVGDGGEASFFNGGSGSVHVIADVLGWFPEGMAYTGLTPARLLDTRAGAPTVDGSGGGGGLVGGGATVEVLVGGRGGVPGGAAAVALNVTATNPRGGGYLTVWPTGAPQPTASSLNFVAGQTVPNMVIVPLGSGGRVSVYNGAGAGTDVIVDVLGWFPAGDAFTGLTPARLMDSRDGGSTIDTRFSGGRPADEALDYNLAIAGRGGVPFGAGAVALNVTVTNPNRPGYLTVKPQGAATPTASNLNFEAGQTVANMVLVPLGGSGQITLVLSDAAPDDLLENDTDVIVDVLGWFPNPTDPPTSYGTNLVLRSNGVGAAVFGDAPAGVIGLIAADLGAPAYDQTSSFPVPEGTGFYDPASGDFFDYPFGRTACWRIDAICVTFGGASPATLGFVGWGTGTGDSGTRLIDTNGLGLGVRGSDLPGAIAVIDLGGCYSYGSGQAASGIDLGLASLGPFFGVFDDESGTWVNNQLTPDQVIVDTMYAGQHIVQEGGDC